MSSLRCKLSGHDLNECGACRRCAAEVEPQHDWQDAERKEPCYQRRVCERCGREHQSPDHDWQPVPPTGVQESALKCSRCGLSI